MGLDICADKVDSIRNSKPPIKEPEVAELLAEGGQNLATTIDDTADLNADMSMICVGTPSALNGSSDLTALKSVSREDGKLIAKQDNYHVVVMRSTVYPGTTEDIVIPLIEDCSGKKVGVDFGVVVNPEFLREGTAVKDFFDPPMIIYASVDKLAANMLEILYENITAQRLHVSIRTAELSKQIMNVYRASKVAFANEVARLCDPIGVNANEVMSLVCADTKLSISPLYLKPGFAFGGSCLPKDTRSIIFESQARNVNIPLIHSILDSNRNHIESCVERIINLKAKSICVLGLSFKSGTDDLRESPVIPLIQRLQEIGVKLKIYDFDVNLGALNSGSYQYLKNCIPNIDDLYSACPADDVRMCDTVVLTKGDQRFDSLIAMLSDQNVVDLSRNTIYRVDQYLEDNFASSSVADVNA